VLDDADQFSLQAFAPPAGLVQAVLRRELRPCVRGELPKAWKDRLRRSNDLIAAVPESPAIKVVSWYSAAGSASPAASHPLRVWVVSRHAGSIPERLAHRDELVPTGRKAPIALRHRHSLLTGPELLTGSTRLSRHRHQRWPCNILSHRVMVQLRQGYGNSDGGWWAVTNTKPKTVPCASSSDLRRSGRIQGPLPLLGCRWRSVRRPADGRHGRIGR